MHPQMTPDSLISLFSIPLRVLETATLAHPSSSNLNNTLQCTHLNWFFLGRVYWKNISRLTQAASKILQFVKPRSLLLWSSQRTKKLSTKSCSSDVVTGLWWSSKHLSFVRTTTLKSQRNFSESAARWVFKPPACDGTWVCLLRSRMALKPAGCRPLTSRVQGQKRK